MNRLLFITILLLSIECSWAQLSNKQIDSTEIIFQNHFFKALQNRFNGNYDRAIINLKACNDIRPNLTVIDAEMGKNYVSMKDYTTALDWFEQLLRKGSNNRDYLRDFITYFNQAKQGDNAIERLRRLADVDSSFRDELIWGYFFSGNYNKVLQSLKQTNLSISQKTKDSLSLISKIRNRAALKEKPTENNIKTENPIEKIRRQIQQFISNNNSKSLLSFADESLETYPTLPILYYAKGWALSKVDKTTEAIPSLLSALDYLIDNPTLEKKIYDEIAIIYKETGDEEKFQFYQQKSKKL